MKDALKDKGLQERIDWAAGRLILSIGRGQFKSELALIVQVIETNAVARYKEEK